MGSWWWCKSGDAWSSSDVGHGKGLESTHTTEAWAPGESAMDARVIVCHIASIIKLRSAAGSHEHDAELQNPD